MLTTINISLPKSMYKDAKVMVTKRGYSSVSELIRDTLRNLLYPNVTENGFTKEFEDQVLEAAKEPVKNDIVLKTDKEIRDYYLHLKLPKKKK